MNFAGLLQLVILLAAGASLNASAQGDRGGRREAAPGVHEQELPAPRDGGQPRDQGRLYRANAFYGDEKVGKVGNATPALRQQFFDECKKSPQDTAAFLAASFAAPGDHGCAAMVVLQCDILKQDLMGFHLARLPGAKARYRVFTAAHVAYRFNRMARNSPLFNAPKDVPAVFAFHQYCKLKFANGGPDISKATLSPVQLINADLQREFVAAKDEELAPRFADFDVAWFDVTANGAEDLLEKAGLPMFEGRSTELDTARVCSIGHFGSSADVVRRCLRAPTRMYRGVITTRVPTVKGMSGGIFAVTVSGDGVYRDYLLGVISREWTGATGKEIGNTGSFATDFQPGRENIGIQPVYW